MAADAELWKGLGEVRGFLEGRAVRHESARGHNSGRVCLDYGSIHAGGEAEVISVDD